MYHAELYPQWWPVWPFRDLVLIKAKELGINEPQLPQQRKLPCRYDSGSSSRDFPSAPKAHFKQAYFEAIDLISNCVQFNQPGCRIYRSLEMLLLKSLQMGWTSGKPGWYVQVLPWWLWQRAPLFPAVDIWNTFPNNGATSSRDYNLQSQTILPVPFLWTSFPSFSSQTSSVVDTGDAKN